MHRSSILNCVNAEPVSTLETIKKSSLSKTLVAAAAVSLSGAALTSQAAIITYAPPTIIGAQVTYPSVSESSNTNTLPLYGAPSVSGNNLIFSNLNFAAISTSGTPPLDFVDGQINFTLRADPGTFLNSLTLSEFGDYNVSATPANPAAVDYVKVYPSAVQITVLAINGVPLATPLVDNTSDVMALSPSGGDFQTGVDPSVGSWTGNAFANLSMLFGSNQITEIAVSFDNQLLAESQTGGIADISKKGFDVIPGPTGGTNLPEPSTAGLALVTIGGTALKRKRRAAR
jgi:hypothetical protein